MHRGRFVTYERLACAPASASSKFDGRHRRVWPVVLGLATVDTWLGFRSGDGHKAKVSGTGRLWPLPAPASSCPVDTLRGNGPPFRSQRKEGRLLADKNQVKDCGGWLWGDKAGVGLWTLFVAGGAESEGTHRWSQLNRPPIPLFLSSRAAAEPTSTAQRRGGGGIRTAGRDLSGFAATDSQ